MKESCKALPAVATEQWQFPAHWDRQVTVLCLGWLGSLSLGCGGRTRWWEASLSLDLQDTFAACDGVVLGFKCSRLTWPHPGWAFGLIRWTVVLAVCLPICSGWLFMD